MASPWLLVGLGNPGPNYDRTRHNAGFWFLEALARREQVPLRVDRTHQALSARIKIGAADVWLCLPQQFMNRSGQAVASMARFYRTPPAQILVVHDDLDLPPGAARLKQGGGNGGHNGLKDIDAQLGSRDYLRLRLGIGHPGQRDLVVPYVLNRPSPDDESCIQQAITQGLTVLPDIINGKLAIAMQALHSSKE